jgi:hypothetical protein
MMNPVATYAGTSVITRSVQSVEFMPRRFASRFTYPIKNRTHAIGIAIPVTVAAMIKAPPASG